MFEVFGEFNSAEEINKAAEGQKEQGDKESLIALAKENGIDEMFVVAYLNGEIPYLVDNMTAALGKLTVELKEEENNSEMIDSLKAMSSYLETHCIEEELAISIRKKGKRLIEAVKEIRKEAESRIKTKKGMVCIHIPPSEVYQMLRNYYRR